MVGLERRLGHAVAAEVEGDEPELVGERAVVLPGPAEVVLRPAVDEQDRRPVRPAPLAHVQPQPAAARTSCIVIRRVRVRRLCERCHRCSPRVRRIDWIVASAERQRIGHTALSLARGCLSSVASVLTGALRARIRCAILRRAWTLARAKCSSAAHGELGELERVLDAARAGSGATVLVAGEAGIGKTRLASELARRARDAGCEVLARSLHRSGRHATAVPAVRRGVASARDAVAGRRAGARLAAAGVRGRRWRCSPSRPRPRPVLLVLEDLHWADTSTLDLVVFLAHNLDGRPLLLLATCSADDPRSAERMRRLADGVRRSGSALMLQLGPLERAEFTALLAAHAENALPAGLTDAIADRAEGNPFFAKELLAASGEHGGALPQELRDVLLQRVARLDQPTQGVLRLAAAAGREVDYPLLRAAMELAGARPARRAPRAPSRTASWSPSQTTGSFRFRHALLAEAIYATILPGEREELHARLAEELARSGRPRAGGAGTPLGGGRAQGRGARRLGRSRTPRRRRCSAWRRRSPTSIGPSRSGTPSPTRAELAGSTSPSSAPGRASTPARSAQAARAVELTRRRSSSSATDDPYRAAHLHVRLGSTSHERAATMPAWPPSSARSSSYRRSRPRRTGVGARLARGRI